MTNSGRVLAVDLGANSIRVAAVDLESLTPTVEVLHRYYHSPVVASDGSLRWDWPRIFAEVEIGLGRGTDSGPVDSIGVDGWGVDYALLDKHGHLVGLPHSYRDTRTKQWRVLAEEIGTERLYNTTGVQLMGINTIFQLAAHDRTERDRATRLLLLPDLLVRDLGGVEGAERSNVSTTGLMDSRTGDWSTELVDALSLDRSLFPRVGTAGLRAGSWRNVPIHVVGSHDTSSAFLGMPGASLEGTVFVSAGTWVVVGMERSTVDTSSEARQLNFCNEVGALGGFRFLKNVVGFLIVERCRSGWGNPPIEVLIDEAASVRGVVPRFDAGDHRFLNPLDMEDEIRRATGMADETPRKVVVRSVLESIVDGIARVIDELSQITGARLTQISMVGGGSRVPLMHELLSRRTGMQVIKGSTEATVLGNALAQGVALGRFNDVRAARKWIDQTGELV